MRNHDKRSRPVRRRALQLVLIGLVAWLAPVAHSTAAARAAAAQTETEAPIEPWLTAPWSGVGSTVIELGVTGPVTFHVTDFQCAGDRFAVFVDGVSAGSTSTPPPSDVDCTPSTPDQACRSANFSSGTFAIGPGEHRIEVRHVAGFESGFVAMRFGPVSCNNAVPQRRIVAPLEARCVESDFVQDLAPHARVGDIVTGGAHPVLIISGAPSCTYNCLDGFDLNCDGRIGDFCPAELDRLRVENVEPCLLAAATARVS